MSCQCDADTFSTADASERHRWAACAGGGGDFQLVGGRGELSEGCQLCGGALLNCVGCIRGILCALKWDGGCCEAL